MTYAISLQDIEAKLSTFFHAFGPKALHFVECLGLETVEKCLPQIAACAASHVCIAALTCEGKDVLDCSKKLN
jgi:hypothetical protein